MLGYQKGELITIASRPGFGKTALALKSVIANIKKCKKVYKKAIQPKQLFCSFITVFGQPSTKPAARPSSARQIWNEK